MTSLMTPMPQSATSPLISVVIPTFNRSALLRRAVESVRSQSYTHWNLLVVDNASTDSTESVVKEFLSDARVSYVRQSHNIGLVANWAFAISSVRTEYFSVLSDDDIVLPDFFKLTIDELQADSTLGMCFGSTPCIDFSGYVHCLAPANMRVGYYRAGQGACAMVEAQHPASTGTLFRTECVQHAGGFNTAAHYLADLDMMLRVAMDYPIKYLGDDVAFHVVHPGNTFKDDSCWFPGLVAVFEGIQRNDHIDPTCRRELFDCLIHTAVVPALRSFVRNPYASYRSHTWSDVLECLRLSKCMIPVLLFRLPILIARDVKNSVKRRIVATFRPPRAADEQELHRLKHPLASDYFP